MVQLFLFSGIDREKFMMVSFLSGSAGRALEH
jgi:hypothetical protein